MKSLPKKYDLSPSAGRGRRSGKKPRAARNKFSTGQHPRPKKNIQTASTKATQSQTRAIKEKRKKRGKLKLKVRSPVLRSKTVRKHTGNVSPRKASSGSAVKKRIIRVLDHGQFLVDPETLRELNKIDNSIVRRLQNGSLDDQEFKTKITQLEGIVKKRGKPLDPKKIVSSDIILPNNDLSIDEARMIFNNEGIIPGLD